ERDHVDEVFLPYKTAVEEPDSRRHDHDQRRRSEHPCNCSRIQSHLIHLFTCNETDYACHEPCNAVVAGQQRIISRAQGRSRTPVTESGKKVRHHICDLAVLHQRDPLHAEILTKIIGRKFYSYAYKYFYIFYATIRKRGV